MTEYYQMILDEFISDTHKPIREVAPGGMWVYSCPICGGWVGCHKGDRKDDEDIGWYSKRDECKYGHKVDWSDEPNE